MAQSIRDFEEGDVGPACRLTNEFIERTAIHFAMRPESEDEFRGAWEEGRARYPWLAAELDGRFAGYAKAGVFRSRAAYAATAETGIYLEREAQGRGLGRALYTELLAQLRAAGFHTAIGGIALPNDVSVRLHESLGFRPCGTLREVGRKFERWHDLGFWQLVFEGALTEPPPPTRSR